MLNQENARKYLKDFMPKEQILKPIIKEKKRTVKKNTIEFKEEEDNGYNVKDIINECPKINVIRDFIKYQASQIKDEDNNLFL